MKKKTKTAVINLTQDQVAIVDAEMFDYLNQWSWQAARIGSRGLFYASRTKTDPTTGKRMTVYMHREVMIHKFGEIPKGLEVDHINNDEKLNNTLSNLRFATSAENKCNRSASSNNKLGVKGVFQTRSGTYKAYINKDGKRYELGSFETLEEAKAAHKAASRIFHQEFGRVS
jgi:phosphotransferase system IIB component